MDLARTSFKIFSAQILVTILATTGIIIFARQFTPAQLGIFFLFQALFAILIDFGGVGIGLAVEKRISEGQKASNIFATGILIQITALLVVISSILFLREPIATFIGADFTLYLLIAVIAATIGDLMLAVLRGELRVEATATLPLLNQIIWIGGGVALLLVGFGVEALVYAFVAGYIAVLLVGGHRVSISIGQPSLKAARSLLSYSKYTFISAMSWQAYSWMDVLVIGWLLSPAFVGAYEIAWRVSGVVTLLSVAISMSVFPQVSAWNADAAMDRIEQLLYDSLTPSLFLIIPSIFGIAVLSNEILEIVFGPEYTVAWLVLIILTIGKIAEGLQAITTNCLYGLNRPGLIAEATIVTGILNVVLNVLFVYQFGFVGAAIATVVAFTVGTIMRFKYLSSILTLRVPYREIGWCMVSGALMGGIVFRFQSTVDIDTALELITAILIGVVVYLSIVLLSSRLRQQAIQTVRMLLP